MANQVFFGSEVGKQVATAAVTVVTGIGAVKVALVAAPVALGVMAYAAYKENKKKNKGKGKR